jgi:hypothetical protein
MPRLLTLVSDQGEGSSQKGGQTNLFSRPTVKSTLSAPRHRPIDKKKNTKTAERVHGLMGVSVGDRKERKESQTEMEKKKRARDEFAVPGHKRS